MKKNWAELIGDDFPLFRAALEEAGVDKAKAQLIIEEVVAYKRANLEWAEYTVNALQEARAEVASLTARLADEIRLTKLEKQHANHPD